MFSVLVVEDKPVVAQQLANCVSGNRWLTLAGAAGNGQQAIEMARRLRPDLVLLDFGLPVPMSGFDVWRVLHEMDKVPDVIAVTGMQDMNTVERAQKYGAFGYVVKPFTREVIHAKLADYAEFRRRPVPAKPLPGQREIDRYLNPRRRSCSLPPGLLPETLDSVLGVLRSAAEPMRAQEIADDAGVDRGTANRYLTYLCDQGIADRVAEHGRPGRPAYLYTVASTWDPSAA
jgi:response regulator of citrate/malate metabolism